MGFSEFFPGSVYNDTSVEKEQTLRDDQQLISEGSFRGDYVIDGQFSCSNANSLFANLQLLTRRQTIL